MAKRKAKNRTVRANRVRLEALPHGDGYMLAIGPVILMLDQRTAQAVLIQLADAMMDDGDDGDDDDSDPAARDAN
jgi:hypothetical protein